MRPPPAYRHRPVPPPGRGVILVLDAGDVAGGARRLRELSELELADVEADDLVRAARLLRAGSYSAVTAARRLEREARRRSSEEGSIDVAFLIGVAVLLAALGVFVVVLMVASALR